MTPIRPRNYLSTPCMVQLTPGVDIDHFENHWFKVSSKGIDWHTLLRHNNALNKILERKVLGKLFTSLIKC